MNAASSSHGFRSSGAATSSPPEATPRPAVSAGADAVLAASVFHFRELTIGQVKSAMAAEGITVR